MPEYCAESEVKARLTANGWRWVAERQHGGAVKAGSTEQDSIDQAITWAGDEIDVAVAPRIQPSDARSQGNAYLRRIAIALAAYYLWTNGGDDAPASLERDFDRAEANLDRIKGGEQVPGLIFNPPIPSVVSGKIPRAFMPRG